jgi:hypothetical protein
MASHNAISSDEPPFIVVDSEGEDTLQIGLWSWFHGPIEREGVNAQPGAATMTPP